MQTKELLEQLHDELENQSSTPEFVLETIDRYKDAISEEQQQKDELLKEMAAILTALSFEDEFCNDKTILKAIVRYNNLIKDAIGAPEAQDSTNSTKNDKW